jgi:hypothetical protein
VNNADADYTDINDVFTDEDDGTMMTRMKKEISKVDGRIWMLKKANKLNHILKQRKIRKVDGRIRMLKREY